MNNGLMKLFGGVSYDPDLKEMGFPLHYLILLSEITLWIGVSSVEELHTKGCGELIRFGRTSYWRKRSLILLAQGVEFFLLVIMCIIFFPGDIPFGRTIGFLADNSQPGVGDVHDQWIDDNTCFGKKKNSSVGSVFYKKRGGNY